MNARFEFATAMLLKAFDIHGDLVGCCRVNSSKDNPRKPQCGGILPADGDIVEGLKSKEPNQASFRQHLQCCTREPGPVTRVVGEVPNLKEGIRP